MKTLVTALMAIVVMAVCGTALAADFVVTQTQVGGNWKYTLQNNHASWDVVEWCLRWSCDDAENDALSALYFNPVDASYISLPANWERAGGTEPHFTTYLSSAAVKHGGNQKDFTIVYKPNAVLPTLFQVGCEQNGQWVGWSDCMPIPEPSSVVALISGLIGSGVLIRRKRP